MTPLVICDFDGTLVDLHIDVEALRATLRNLFSRAGVECDFRPLLPSLTRVHAELGDEELWRRAWAIIDEEELRACERAELRPGAGEFLQRLAGAPIALFSNNSRRAVERSAQCVGLHLGRFGQIIARTQPGSLKPSAQPILELCARDWGCSIDRIVLLGDHPYDMESARDAAQILSQEGDPRPLVAIGLPQERAGAVALEQAGAWFIAADLEEAAALAITPRSPHELSLVYLALNEQASIPGAIAEARRFAQLYLSGYQIVIVDDGSTDGTSQAAEAAGEDVCLVRHLENRGMGAAMRSGYRASSKNYIAHLPADRQVRAQALLPFLERVHPECVVTSRYSAAPAGKQRALLSWIFRLLVEKVGGLTVDFAGTYLFHRRWLERVALHTILSNTFLFSFELLQRFAEAGASFQTVQIHPFPRVDGQSRELALRRIANVAREIVRYRWRQVRGYSALQSR